MNYDAIPTLYVDYAEVAKPTLSVKFRVETFERNTDFSKVEFNPKEKLSPEIEHFLKPTQHIPNDGIVKQKAEEITKGVKGDLERAKAIYTWVANTMQRDNSILGCGTGDVKAILESGKMHRHKLGICGALQSRRYTCARDFRYQSGAEQIFKRDGKGR